MACVIEAMTRDDNACGEAPTWDAANGMAVMGNALIGRILDPVGYLAARDHRAVADQLLALLLAGFAAVE